MSRTLVAVVTIFSAGCATLGPVSVPRGGDPPLVVVNVRPLEDVRRVCGLGGESQALACFTTITNPGGIVTAIFHFPLPPASYGLTQARLEAIATVFAHEACHGVARYHLLAKLITVDPCHGDLGADHDAIRRGR